ncbi:MAG: transmembrane 220 family protein [Rudanella sp.]|nr:transmembrane 220 family protein [Rudanella sp.]
MLKPIAIAFALLFALFAGFQYNDPDPEIWIPIYGLATLASIMALFRVGRPWFYWVMAAMYVVAAVYQWPPHFEGFLLDEMGMKTVNIELAREAGGLAICAAAMVVLGVLVRKRQ